MPAKATAPPPKKITLTRRVERLIWSLVAVAASGATSAGWAFLGPQPTTTVKTVYQPVGVVPHQPCLDIAGTGVAEGLYCLTPLIPTTTTTRP